MEVERWKVEKLLAAAIRIRRILYYCESPEHTAYESLDMPEVALDAFSHFGLLCDAALRDLERLLEGALDVKQFGCLEGYLRVEGFGEPHDVLMELLRERRLFGIRAQVIDYDGAPMKAARS